LGFAIAFAYSYALCANAKLWVLVGVLAAGMIGYLTIETMENKKPKKNEKE
jgi:Na+/H+ antiporter NhaA